MKKSSSLPDRLRSCSSSTTDGCSGLGSSARLNGEGFSGPANGRTANAISTRRVENVDRGQVTPSAAAGRRGFLTCRAGCQCLTQRKLDGLQPGIVPQTRVVYELRVQRITTPPSVRSLVRSDVSLPGGAGAERLLTRPGSPRPAGNPRPEQPGRLAGSPESVMSRLPPRDALCNVTCFN
ncbi:hypothetical protein EYF80_042771 [Liparis tanakae]|uniref:Uncharacterized protein n=1 Tax=Liparis tanakae TaxID=230148 RepID=A0A4Z2G0E7_9TELE|nr:hypothetical protein EYF80_042771 [Liparis tanakae]